MKEINAFGLKCPQPLVLAKKALVDGEREIAVLVDNDTAVKNVSRLGEKSGMSVVVETIAGGWRVVLGGSGMVASAANIASAACAAEGGQSYAVFVGKDVVGAGDDELGRSLMKMALYTLSESDDVPASVLFMNAGVKLVAGDGQAVESVRKLVERGTEVLVCGTCLDFYGLKESLAVGEVSNMYDILGHMQEVSKVITL